VEYIRRGRGEQKNGKRSPEVGKTVAASVKKFVPKKGRAGAEGNGRGVEKR